MIKVSVIVPIYNCESFLSKCVDSIINQTLNDIEIILINDGSTDKSGEIADEYSKQDNRIVVIHQQNSGPSVARNKGINIAKGKYIGFVDSDDYVEPLMYEKLYSAAYPENVQISMCNYKEIYHNNNLIITSNIENNRIYRNEDIRANIIKTFTGGENYGFFSLWNKIYLKDWLLGLGIHMDEGRDHGEDWWFNINLFMQAESFIGIEDPLYNYVRINTNSLMTKYRENQFDLFLDGRLKILSTIPKELINFKELNRTFVYEFSSYIIRTYKNVKDKKQCRKLVRNVIYNEEVKESCRNVHKLPIHFKITTFFIRFNLNFIALYLYKLRSLI